MAKTLLDLEEEEEVNFFSLKIIEEDNKEEYCFSNEKTLFIIAQPELMAFMEKLLQDQLLKSNGELLPC